MGFGHGLNDEETSGISTLLSDRPKVVLTDDPDANDIVTNQFFGAGSRDEFFAKASWVAGFFSELLHVDQTWLTTPSDFIPASALEPLEIDQQIENCIEIISPVRISVIGLKSTHKRIKRRSESRTKSAIINSQSLSCPKSRSARKIKRHTNEKNSREKKVRFDLPDLGVTSNVIGSVGSHRDETLYPRQSLQFNRKAAEAVPSAENANMLTKESAEKMTRESHLTPDHIAPPPAVKKKLSLAAVCESLHSFIKKSWRKIYKKHYRNATVTV